MVRPLHCVASIVFIMLLTGIKPDAAISAFLLSFGISYVLSYVAAFAVLLIFAPIASGGPLQGADAEFNNLTALLIYSIASVLQLLLAFLIFRIRRFKKGFPFILKGFAIIAALVITGAVLIVAALGRAYAETETEDAFVLYVILAGIFTIGIGAYIWIRRGIKTMQRKWAKQRNEELLQKEIDKLTRENEQLKINQETQRVANHSISHRLRAAERSVSALLEKAGEHDEFAELRDEMALELGRLGKLKQDYQDMLSHEKVDVLLPSTNIKAVDDMFGLFARRFADSRIEFRLKVAGSVVYMAENIIDQGKLETMIGDHLQDALIAVNANDVGARRCVMAAIGESGGCYGFSVHDTGIPFEVDTLTRLGMERVTTRAGKGGSGIGFMKTFETMRECGASLIIDEHRPGGAFSKSVAIRFDMSNEYIIRTYRPDEFPASDRYRVVALE